MKTKLTTVIVLLLIAGIVFPIASLAQDIIIKKNGLEINSKVLEIDSSGIKYKKSDNMDGPTYIIPKSDVFMIKFANGTKEIISALDEPKTSGQENENVNAKKIFREQKSYVSLGYGFGTYFLWFDNYNYYQQISSSLIGPVYGKYEYAVTEDFGIGVNLAYVEYENSYNYEGYDYVTGYYAGTYTETDTYRSFSGVLRANWHFGNSAKVDPYLGFGLGYRTATVKYTSNDPQQMPHYENYYNNGVWGGNQAFPIGFETTFGVRIRFSDHIGAYAEAGFAKSAVQIGLMVKF